jgi:hypothetical protein
MTAGVGCRGRARLPVSLLRDSLGGDPAHWQAARPRPTRSRRTTVTISRVVTATESLSHHRRVAESGARQPEWHRHGPAGGTNRRLDPEAAAPGTGGNETSARRGVRRLLAQGSREGASRLERPAGVPAL